jgi:aquaporin Z
VAAGFGEHSLIQAPVAAVVLLELLGAAIIVAVFLGAGGREGGSRTVAPVAVGLSFAALLQVGQSVGNLPFNPARAVASAIFSSGWAVEQLWVFLVAPLAGGAIAGLVFRISAVAGSSAPLTDLGAGGEEAGSGQGGADVDGGAADVARDGGTAHMDGSGSEAIGPEDGGPDGLLPVAAAGQEKPRGVSEAQEFFDRK